MIDHWLIIDQRLVFYFCLSFAFSSTYCALLMLWMYCQFIIHAFMYWLVIDQWLVFNFFLIIKLLRNYLRTFGTFFQFIFSNSHLWSSDMYVCACMCACDKWSLEISCAWWYWEVRGYAMATHRHHLVSVVYNFKMSSSDLKRAFQV